MQLYLKQRVFTIGDQYDIYDVNGNPVFHVGSEIFTIGAKMHLCDLNGTELYYIRQNFTLFLAQYEIYRNDLLCAVVSQEFAFFSAKLNVESELGRFDITGDFMGMNFQITLNGQYFGSICKKWLSWGDTYELDIPDAGQAPFVCALVAAIDNCIHNDRKNHHGGF